MKGTEKQINWATEIKSNVMTTINEMLNMVKSDPQYDATNAMMADFTAMWESRATKLDVCDDASYIIDFFRDFYRSSDLTQNIRSLQSIYKVHVNNGYNFK